MHKSLALMAVAALAFAGAASADDTLGAVGAGVGVNANVKLSTVDTNADGKVSKEEAASSPDLAKQFDKLDADHDGNLSQAEFAKFEGKADTKVGMKKGKKTTPASDSGSTGTAPTTSDDSMAPDKGTTTKPGH